MSQYTTEVRWICEMNSGFDYDDLNKGKYSPDEIIDASHSKIFNFAYPIFEEEHRPVLEKKILKHYYTREIAAETVELWKLWMNDTLNLIMPKYNALYENIKKNYDRLLQNIDVTTDYEREENTNANHTNDTDFTHGHKINDNQQTDVLNTNKSDWRTAHSDTPQGGISQVDGLGYLTDYTRQFNTGTDGNGGTTDHTTGSFDKNRSEQKHSGTDKTHNEGTAEGKLNEDSARHEYGYRGGKTYLELLNQMNDEFINVDMLVINDLQDLFFKLW